MCFASATPSNKASQRASREARTKEDALMAQQRADQERMAQEARQAQIDRQANIQRGLANINNAFRSYNPSYYQGLQQNYMDFYNRDLSEQKQKADQQALFGLARQGLIGSSAANTAFGDLSKAYGNKQQEIESNAQNYANSARSQIENQRQNLIAQLNMTGGDPASASMFTGGGNAALLGNLAPQAPQLPTFSPLGDAFTNVTNLLAQDATRASAYGKQGLLPTAFRSVIGGRGADRYVA
jgi:hypothetical protein